MGTGLRHTTTRLCAACAVLFTASAAWADAGAQTIAEVAPTLLPEVVVVAPSPIAKASADQAAAPIQADVLTAQDLVRDGEPNVLRTLEQEVAGVNLDFASGNPFQPSLFYHGFQASPLQGVSQGLAVYVDGVRQNQPFGDTVDWDLIPSVAIERLTVEGANPVFGLNALGGSVDARLKTGFDFTGGEADLSGGAFGQVQGDAQYGGARNGKAAYVAASVLHQAGWRDPQSTDIANLYADLGWRPGDAELHLSLRLARSDLNGPGSSPVELLAVAPKAQFTAPNDIKNEAAAVSLRGSGRLAKDISVQGVVYFESFSQRVANGNAPNDTPCDDGSGLLCSDDDHSTTTGGATVPAFLGPNPLAYSELDRQTTNTDGYGAAVQLTDTHALFGRRNRLIVGATFDGAQTGFSASSYVGGITTGTRVFTGPGVLIDEPGNNAPVQVDVSDAYWGVFGSDTVDLTSRLSLTVSARYNDAEIRLADRLGGDLNGRHAYRRLNPAAAATWRVAGWLTAYAGYAEANRAPTPAELSCASPADSCSLANFFVGDPDLKQVTARTVDAGLRGRTAPIPTADLSWSVDLYRTDLDDDIGFINSPTLGRAYFANIGRTRREGVDAEARFTTRRWRIYAGWSHTLATYRTGFVEAAGANPAADADGNLTIRPGDRLPGVPEDQLKLGLDVQATRRLALGASAVGRSRTPLFGDEANLTPDLPGYILFDLHASYRLSDRLELFARGENVTDRTYATYGTFSPVGAVFLHEAPGAANPRSLSPGAPAGAFLGVRATF